MVLYPLGNAARHLLSFCGRNFAAGDVAFANALRRRGRFVIPHPAVLTSNRKVTISRGWGLSELFGS